MDVPDACRCQPTNCVPSYASVILNVGMAGWQDRRMAGRIAGFHFPQFCHSTFLQFMRPPVNHGGTKIAKRHEKRSGPRSHKVTEKSFHQELWTQKSATAQSLSAVPVRRASRSDARRRNRADARTSSNGQGFVRRPDPPALVGLPSRTTRRTSTAPRCSLWLCGQFLFVRLRDFVAS